MNDQTASLLPTDAVRWLAEGSEHAPAELLGRTLARTRATRQRSRFAAVMLGAPTIKTSSRSVSAVRAALVAALVLAGLVAAILIAGTPRRDQLVVAPTPGPSVGPSPLTSPTESPEVPLAPDFGTGFGATIVQDVNQPWTSVRHKPSDNPRRRFAENQLEVFYGTCPECADTFRVDVTFGSRSDGVVVGWHPCEPDVTDTLACMIAEGETGGIPEFVQGDTTDALASAWMARYGEALATQHEARQVEWTILHYPGRVVALVVRLEQAVVVSLGAFPNLTTGQRETFVPHFLDLITFITPLPASTDGPRSGTLGDLEIAVPPGWHLSGDGIRGLLLIEDGDFLSMSVDLAVLDPGDTLGIHRSSGSVQGTFTITGQTIDDLVASIDRGLGDGSRAEARIADAPGFRWGVPQRAIVGPLFQMAALEWRGRFYVFQVHLPLDGAPGDVLGPILDGVTLK